MMSDMYQHTLDQSRKQLSIDIMASSVFSCDKEKHKKLGQSTTNIIPTDHSSANQEYDDPARPSHLVNSSTIHSNAASVEALLNRLEALDLDEGSSSCKSIAEPTPSFRLRSQIIKSSRLAFDLRDTILNGPYNDEEYDYLYTQTEIPIPKGVKELTKEENELVDNILRKNQNGMVSQFKTAVVEFKDIYKLYPETWLNDEIINFYMVLLMDRANNNNHSTNVDLPSIHCFNTFFCSSLRDQGYDKVRRWTKKVDIFNKHLLLIPINKSYHWTLGVVDMKRKNVTIYDSLNGKHHGPTIKLIMNYLELEHMDKKKTPFDASGWKGIMASDIPQQGNSSDCGVFTCTFAERLTRNQGFDFSQDDMTSIRRRMVLDIVQKKLSI
ncbi:uncharacterized protein BX664DRAFT_320886 [Halteromyces radiatus]|uniref:uncharacterized protein n=1 Tax=Halteromyces radiatus TaxID=101107 RepID=UPI00221E5C2F|nr:uncharacterized protein BX664DRAFT_320886 [Halteromyces radiatus]KAI8099265.1 hypothetical protein BX664DRAFT_320886 [Halteromyces radiatus]